MHSQLLICINSISGVIFVSHSMSPSFAFTWSKFFCGTLSTSFNKKSDTSLELSYKLSSHIQYTEVSVSEKFGVLKGKNNDNYLFANVA